MLTEIGTTEKFDTTAELKLSNSDLKPPISKFSFIKVFEGIICIMSTIILELSPPLSLFKMVN